MKIAILIISFLLDGIITNFISIDSIFYPLFTLVALIVIFPYFNDNKDYYKSAFAIGLAYDLIYTDTLIYYSFLFLFLSFLISKLIKFLADNYISLIIITLIIIVIFRSITFLFISLIGNIPFDINIWFKSIYSSVIINIIYVIILSIVTNFLSNKFRIRKSSLRYW